LIKRLEQQSKGALDLEVRIEHDASCAVVHQPDWQRHLELAAARFVQDAALQARLENVQLGFAHGALQPEQKAVVEVRRGVDPVFVKDERARQSGRLDQAMPVGVVAGKAGDFEPLNNASVAQCDLGHKALEAVTVARLRAGQTQPLSMTCTRSSGQPNATARSRNAY